MTDFLRLQQDLAFALSADSYLESVNIITRDRLLQEWETRTDFTYEQEVLAAVTPRNGRKGAAIVVERPVASTEKPNVPGPQFSLRLTFLCVEHLETNEAKDTGTLLPADMIAQRVASVLHLMPFGTCEIYCSRDTIVENKELRPLRAYLVTLLALLPRDEITRCAVPTISETGLSVTLTAGSASDQIYYTTDGTFPAQANTSAMLYTGAFTVASGTVVRWAAYRAGILGSGCGQATVT